jgi:hypothetical protein
MNPAASTEGMRLSSDVSRADPNNGKLRIALFFSIVAFVAFGCDKGVLDPAGPTVKMGSKVPGYDARILDVRDITHRELIENNPQLSVLGDETTTLVSVGISLVPNGAGCIDLGSSMLTSPEGTLDSYHDPFPGLPWGVAVRGPEDKAGGASPKFKFSNALEHFNVTDDVQERGLMSVGTQKSTLEYSVEQDKDRLAPGLLRNKGTKEIRLELLYRMSIKAKTFALALSNRRCPR